MNGFRRQIRHLASLLLLVALAAAPAHAVGERPVRSLLETRHDRLIVQDWDLSCGAAALATLLTYQLDDPVTEKEVARGLIRREEYLNDPNLLRARQGFSLLDLKRFVDARGYQGVGLGKLVVDDLKSAAPIMVPVRFNGYDHFVIFRGVARTASGRSRVLLADPAFGNRTMPLEDFEAAWLDHPQFGRIGFTVALADGAAPPNRLAPEALDFVTFH